MKQIPNLKKVNHIHLIGIGGAGMGGIAEVLLNQGYTITGSDLVESEVTEHLRELGATIYLGHNARHLKSADLAITSTAISKNNPEVKAAHSKQIPVISRAQMLGELMRLQEGIAIAGTHGKTTTTSLIASIFTEARLDPTFVIGGLLNSAGSNAKLGKGKYFIAEADESDASFLYLRPKMAVVTNIDADHMETYGNDFACLCATFLDFLQQLPFYGEAVVCIDDPVIKELIPEIGRPVLTYGFSKEAQIQTSQFKQIGTKSRFKVRWKQKLYSFTLNLPGKHNASNATAAIAVAFEAGIKLATIQAALRKFQGVGRRFQMHDGLEINGKKVLLINDYGHHPKELEVTMQAVRDAWPERRLVLVFQPHRYTRTRDLFDEFTRVLATADSLLLLDIYPASEAPIKGVTGKGLAEGITNEGKIEPIFVKQLKRLPTVLEGVVRNDDILLFQGAGTIDLMATEMVRRYGR